MNRVMIFEIGYEEYAVDLDDAISLLRIAKRALRVKRTGYGANDPWMPDQDAQPFTTRCTLGILQEGGPPPVAASPESKHEDIVI
jgi:hypothetical protein